MQRTLILPLVITLMISTASAWEIKSTEFDIINKTLTIEFDLNPFERLILLIIGGDYTKHIAESYIDGDYTLISAGYDQVKIKVHGNIKFKKPTEVLIKNSDYYYHINTTYLKV
uniref:Uncharacterized protein n=1 Tax=Geoglobus ahangari TaxID=113653 RepID=A0A7J3THF4_9EURY